MTTSLPRRCSACQALRTRRPPAAAPRRAGEVRVYAGENWHERDRPRQFPPRPSGWWCA